MRKDARTAPPAEARRVLRGDVEEIADCYERTDTARLPWPETRDEQDAVRVERQELKQISIRLPKEDLDALCQRAARSGIGYTTLIRMILREHLNNPLGVTRTAKWHLYRTLIGLSHRSTSLDGSRLRFGWRPPRHQPSRNGVGT